MDFDRDKAEEVVMALLFLTSFDDHGFARAWKSHDWGLLDGLHRRGWIHDPKGKAKSVVLTEEGRARARELFERYFGTQANSPQEPASRDQTNRES
ncbi:MAG: hypothetical protein JNM25_11165 [Planctomycetes bacterium]|nr:hypothetical protein [Planctomycetota bacterium]